MAQFIRFELARPNPYQELPSRKFSLLLGFQQFILDEDVLDQISEACYAHDAPTDTSALGGRPAWHWFKNTEAAERAIQYLDRAHELADGAIVKYEANSLGGELLYEDEFQVVRSIPQI